MACFVGNNDTFSVETIGAKSRIKTYEDLESAKEIVMFLSIYRNKKTTNNEVLYSKL